MVATTTELAPTPPAWTANGPRSERMLAAGEAAAHDAGLVRRFNAGDDSAFVEIVARHRAKAFALAFGILKDRADAEEMAQDTFIRAHRGLAGFRFEASLATWLYRIACNLSRNRRQHNLSRRRDASLSIDSACGADGPATFSDRIASQCPNPALEATAGEFGELVATCMERLSPEHREILTLRNTHNQSYGEIASSLRTNTGTVKSRIGRARRHLRRLLAQQYPDWTPEASPFDLLEPVRSPGRVAVACL